MAGRGDVTQLPAVQTDALIESSFRRLLSAVETERENIRAMEQMMDAEKDGTYAELETLRQEHADFCYKERQKISAEWKHLDVISDTMANFFSETREFPVQINCSGMKFVLPRSVLCSVEGCKLTHMFSDAFIHKVQRDSDGNFYLDYNPNCFKIIVEFLQNRRLKHDAPIPTIPEDQLQNMELLAQALKLRPFLKENSVSTVHGTSLVVNGNVVTATHPGWQVVASSQPLPMAGPSYFEVEVLANPDAKGGLAVGICGRVPQGHEVHSIRLAGSVMYNSDNGLIGDAVDLEGATVEPKLSLGEGNRIGIRHEPSTHQLIWFYDRRKVGVSTFLPEFLDKNGTLYAVFAMYVPEQKLKVDFHTKSPEVPAPDHADASAMSAIADVSSSALSHPAMG